MKIATKRIILICSAVLLAAIIAIVLAVVFTRKETIWKPEVQGSYVREMAYEEISQDFLVEKYADYKSFSKSDLADYEFVTGKKATAERYSKEYFESKDLAILKFNQKSKIEYYVTEAVFSDGKCAVKVKGTIKATDKNNSDATYYCFLETGYNVSEYDFSITVEEETEYESRSINYITMENAPYLFQNKDAPELFLLDSKAGLESFIDEDPVLTKQSFGYAILNSYGEEFYETHSLLLIRIPSSDFESWIAVREGDAVELVCFRSNHYLYSKETKYHILIALAVEKTSEFKTVKSEKYSEYEDGITSENEKKEYSLTREEPSLEGVTKYRTAE